MATWLVKQNKQLFIAIISIFPAASLSGKGKAPPHGGVYLIVLLRSGRDGHSLYHFYSRQHINSARRARRGSRHILLHLDLNQ